MKRNETQSINLDALDVEELERRLELAANTCSGAELSVWDGCGRCDAKCNKCDAKQVNF